MDQNEIYRKISEGPAFLLLGQDYLQLESGTDPFLSELLRKYGPNSDNEKHTYRQMLKGEASKEIDTALAWMQGLCERLSPPQWLKMVANFAWSGIYTSAIDIIWMRAFRSEWRELQPLIEERYKPNDPRNRSRLLCTFLFGCVNRVEETERPPLTLREWSKRRHVAIALARRLPEILTPFGILLIEGYAGERDWLSPDDLAPVIDDLNSNQAHMFSVTETLHNELISNHFITELLEEDKLILHSESLSFFLLQGETTGLLKLNERPEKEEYGRSIRWGEKVRTVPSHIWNQVSRSAIILDDTILTPGNKLSKEKRYYEFRNFLADSSLKLIWSGYDRGFAFRREFEKTLLKEIKERLKSGTLQHEPVILHGQTGTGKTVALGTLAYEIRKERKYPVLFIERKSQRPVSSDIDAFCKWAEDNDAAACLIIWDGMLEIEQYYDLLLYLVGRGRKVAVIGTSYKLDTQKLDMRKLSKSNLIAAPATLNKTEIADFRNFLNEFDIGLGQIIDSQLQQNGDLPDPTFLVALYRLLPPTRALIRTGVLKETGLTEQKIQKIVQEEQWDPNYENTLAQALRKVGLITSDVVLKTTSEDLGGEKVNEIQKLIGLVMVPGSFGLKIPIELLLRTLGKGNITNFVSLLNKFDIFRWHEDAVGNIFIGPRHPLEARLVIQSRLGGASTEIVYVRQLLLEIHDTDGFLDNHEIQFAVDFLRSMRPDDHINSYGRNAIKFIPYFRDLAETLKGLREERNVQNPRLMLQEATFLREAVREQSKTDKPYTDADDLLDRAEAIVNQALKLLNNDHRNKKIRSVMLVELASILGTKVRQILDSKIAIQGALQLFNAVREEIFRARVLDPENYYPIDVFAWVTRDLIASGVLDLDARANAEVDILHVFEMADTEDFSVLQKERFEERRMMIAEVLNNTKLSENAFNSLITQGSSAGYYLKAHNTVGELANEEISLDQRKRYYAAAKYLEDNRKIISQDGRSLYLLLRLWWMLRTGRPMFYGERQVVPFNQDDWKYCQGIILDLMNTSEFYITPSIKYLQGITSFHLGDIEDSFEIFRELEREAEYIQGRRRIIRSYLASIPDGQPRVFNGTVDWVNGEGTRGTVYVEELRRKILFIPQDFRKPTIQRHEVLSGFHLAFNFIAPIADPASYYWTQQERKL